MNNKDLLAALSERLGITRRLATEMLEASTQAMVGSVSEQKSLVLQGFGAFEIRKKNSRVIMNPSTGAAMNVPEKRTLVFKPSETYKSKIVK